MIGALLPAPLTCGDPNHDPDHQHLPATYHPWHDATACLCGVRWWEGRIPTAWKSVSRFDGVGATARVIGWDTYEMRTT